MFSGHFSLPARHPEKVSLFGRGIGVLDPEECGSEVGRVVELDLSHNCITRIGDVVRFKAL